MFLCFCLSKGKGFHFWVLRGQKQSLKVRVSVLLDELGVCKTAGVSFVGVRVFGFFRKSDRDSGGYERKNDWGCACFWVCDRFGRVFGFESQSGRG